VITGGTLVAYAGVGSPTVVAAGTYVFRLTLTLPAAAGNTFQNLSSTLSFAFSGVQRDAVSK
jgi:hypothetical protein